MPVTALLAQFFQSEAVDEPSFATKFAKIQEHCIVKNIFKINSLRAEICSAVEV